MSSARSIGLPSSLLINTLMIMQLMIGRHDHPVVLAAATRARIGRSRGLAAAQPIERDDVLEHARAVAADLAAPQSIRDRAERVLRRRIEHVPQVADARQVLTGQAVRLHLRRIGLEKRGGRVASKRSRLPSRVSGKLASGEAGPSEPPVSRWLPGASLSNVLGCPHAASTRTVTSARNPIARLYQACG